MFVSVGVQTVVTELSTGKVIVRGNMDENKLVDYVYRRTKKQAKIVPQPEPEPAEPENKEADKPEGANKPEEEKKGEEGGGGDDNKNDENKEEKGTAGEEVLIGDENNGNYVDEVEGMKRMMYYNYQPLYMVERIPPPQLFSDENPNACCIS